MYPTRIQLTDILGRLMTRLKNLSDNAAICFSLLRSTNQNGSGHVKGSIAGSRLALCFALRGVRGTRQQLPIDHRTTRDHAESWEFTCPRCGLDFTVSEDELIFRSVPKDWLFTTVHFASSLGTKKVSTMEDRCSFEIGHGMEPCRPIMVFSSNELPAT